MLTSAVSKMELVALNWFNTLDNPCSSDQLHAILKMLAENRQRHLKLKKLMIGMFDVTNIPVTDFAMAVGNLNCVYFKHTTFTIAQIHSLVHIANSACSHHSKPTKIVVRHPIIIGG